MTAQMSHLAAQRINQEWQLTSFGGGWEGPWPGGANFYLLDHAGEPIHTFVLSNILPEFDRFASPTTAGVRWHECRFVYIWKNRWVVICPWWNQRVFICLENMAVEKECFLFCEALDWERKRILRTLEDSLSQCESGNLEAARDFDTEFQILSLSSAMHFAGIWKISDAIPLLQELEKQPWGADSWCGDSSEFGQRRIAQIALRRLGVAPQARAPVVIENLKMTEVNGLKRLEQVSQIRSGLSRQQVVGILGHPDFERDSFRYDIDGGKPFSLIVDFNESEVVERVRSLSPPLWHGHLLFPEANPPYFSADTTIYPHEYDGFLGTIKDVTNAIA